MADAFKLKLSGVSSGYGAVDVVNRVRNLVSDSSGIDKQRTDCRPQKFSDVVFAQEQRLRSFGNVFNRFRRVQ